MSAIIFDILYVDDTIIPTVNEQNSSIYLDEDFYSRQSQCTLHVVLVAIDNDYFMGVVFIS